MLYSVTSPVLINQVIYGAMASMYWLVEEKVTAGAARRIFSRNLAPFLIDQPCLLMCLLRVGSRPFVYSGSRFCLTPSATVVFRANSFTLELGPERPRWPYACRRSHRARNDVVNVYAFSWGRIRGWNGVSWTCAAELYTYKPHIRRQEWFVNFWLRFVYLDLVVIRQVEMWQNWNGIWANQRLPRGSK